MYAGGLYSVGYGSAPGPASHRMLLINDTAGVKAEKIMKTGSLVPDAMILQLIVSELTTRGWLSPCVQPEPYTLNATSTGSPSTADDMSAILDAPLEINDEPSASFVLDGFPRTAAQASQLDALIPINLVVHLNTPLSVILDRIANRWVHAPSGRVYNTTFNPPKEEGKDDVTGEPLTRRADDSPETWEKRIKTFNDTSMPLLEHYDKQGVLWEVEGNTSDEISPKLFEEFGRRFGAQT